MSGTYTVWLSAPTGERVARLQPLALRYRRVVNEVGFVDLAVPFDAVLLRELRLDARIEVWRHEHGQARLEGETIWLLRYVRPFLLGTGERGIEIGAVSANELLKRRIVAYAAGTPQAQKSGPADDLMKAIVAENFTAPVDGTRTMPLLQVAPNLGAGLVVTKSCARRPVAMVLRELARASEQGGVALFFDVVGGVGRSGLTFRTWTAVRGIDHSTAGVAPVTLSAEWGTLSAAERPRDRAHEVTAAYAGGQGLGLQRDVALVVDAARAGASLWNRRETFVDARHGTTAAALQTEAAAVVQGGAPLVGFRGTVVSRPGAMYGQQWRWGDVVQAAFAGEVVRCRVRAVEVRVELGEETIGAELQVLG